MINLSTHSKVSLGYFLIAAVLGMVLRLFYLLPMPVNYKFMVHTHSHIALLGWIYLALTTLIYKLYLGETGAHQKYRGIFWFTQLTLVGMLLTFPFQGYALFSIVFSTLFLFASYGFFLFFFRHVPSKYKETGSYKCIKAALWYLVISSVGPWALGAIMNTLGAESVWYRSAIYFYLHFLYNGWMIMALTGMFLYVLEHLGLNLPERVFRNFIRCMNLGIVLTLFLSLLFAKPPIIFHFLGGAGALLQLWAFGMLIKSVFPVTKMDNPYFSRFQMGLLKTVTVLLGLKMMLQLLTALPNFSVMAVTYLDFTIGYLHGTFLGVVTLALFLFFDYFGLVKIPKNAYWVYMAGFIGTEALIFYRGISAWLGLPFFEGYYRVLALVSLCIPLGLILILLANRKRI